MRQTLTLGLTALLLTACAGQTSADNHSSAPVLCPLDTSAQGDESARLDTAIHAYLTTHPEVLMEMSIALRQKQQDAQQAQAKQALAKHHDAIYADISDPVVGNPAGVVTIVEFFDSECPFCKRVAPDLERLIAENKDVRLIYKEYPILGAGSQIAARAAFAAMRQGKYDAFHSAVMADKTPEHQLAEPRVMEIAKGAGLDISRLKADMASPEIAAKIAANIGLAHQLGITGTPGLIIGDNITPGAMPYPALLQAVAAARAAKP